MLISRKQEFREACFCQTSPQLVRQFLPFYGNRSSIAAFTKAVRDPTMDQVYQVYTLPYYLSESRYSVVGTATRYGLDGPGIESRQRRNFPHRPDRPWGPPSLLPNGYRVSSPWVKRPGRGVDHPPPSRTEVKEGIELYLYSPYGPSWPILG